MAYELGTDPFATGLPPTSPNTTAGSIWHYMTDNPVTNYIGGAATSVENAVTGIGSGISSTASSVGGFFTSLTSKSTWDRVGLIILGIMFIGFALFSLTTQAIIRPEISGNLLKGAVE